MNSIDKVKFGKFVAERRKELGYTQNDLAQKLFVSAKAVSKWETAVNLPDINILVALSEILEVSVTELLLCEMSEKNMDANQVENLVKTAISFCDVTRSYKTHRGLIADYIILLILTVFFSTASIFFGAFSETYITLEILSLVFGFYFFIWVQEKLPGYYDENRISAYADGFFRINIPGLTFNNSNWPHIIKAARRWIALSLFFIPFYSIIQEKVFESTVWFEYGFLIVYIFSLFISIYIPGKKYE